MAQDRFADKILKKFPTLGYYAQRVRRSAMARTGAGYPDWTALVDGSESWKKLKSEASGQNVLFDTSIGGSYLSVNIESALGAALTLRGAKCSYLLCDGTVSACFRTNLAWYPNAEKFLNGGPQKDLCKNCRAPAQRAYATLGLPVWEYSEFLNEEDRESCRDLAKKASIAGAGDLNYRGISIGEHALSSTYRFFFSGDLTDESKAEDVYQRYVESCALAALVAERIIEIQKIDVVVSLHGLYMASGVVGEVARKMGVRFVAWNMAYRKNCFIFSHHDTYHHTLLEEPVSDWQGIDFGNAEEEVLMSYLRSRWHGSEDWIKNHESPEFDLDGLRELGVDTDKPMIGLLTNVLWDAQLFYASNAFPSMLDWLEYTISYFKERPDLQLIIRVHPAEVHGRNPARQTVMGYLSSRGKELPSNVFVVAANNPLSTYLLAEQCDSMLIYGTKTGVELTSMGIPTVVAGEAWIRGKGLTQDATSADQYKGILDQLPVGSRMQDEVVHRARKYAYHFFYRRMIPLDFVRPAKNGRGVELAFESMDDLRPGKSKQLDLVLSGILEGSPFIYRAEEMAEG